MPKFKRFLRSALCVALLLSAAVGVRAEAPYNVAWSRQFGTAANDYGTRVAVDGAANAYISGHTVGSLAGPSAGGLDAFLAKYDGAGNAIWSHQIGTTGSDYSYGVGIDGSGNAYLSGYTGGSLGGPNAGSYDAFLTKYDGAGNLAWSRQIGTASDDYVSGSAVDGTGNAYISGYTNGSLGGPNAGSYDAFLTKYDGAGNLLWARQIGTTGDDLGVGAALDGSGNAYIAGYTNGSIDGPNAGTLDAFLTKYDGAGNVLWSRQLGTADIDIGQAVAVDAAGNAYITGYTNGSLDGPNAGSSDVFLTKYDGAGNLLWTRQIGTTTDDYSVGAAVDSSGNVYLTGYTTGGSLGGPAAGFDDAFLIKYDGAGNLLWSQQIGTPDFDESLGVALDAAGNAYIGGWTYGSLGGPNPLPGLSDAFLVKFAVPEPSAFMLAALGAMSVVSMRRGRRRYHL